jgi:transposase
MGKPLSMDLRERVMEAIDGGMSRRGAAARYGIAPATAIRWDNERRTTGSFAPKRQGGDMRSQRIEAHAGVIHAALEEIPDITLAELCERLSELGIASSTSSLWRFLRRHSITRKKRPATMMSQLVV